MNDLSTMTDQQVRETDAFAEAVLDLLTAGWSVNQSLTALVLLVARYLREITPDDPVALDHNAAKFSRALSNALPLLQQDASPEEH